MLFYRAVNAEGRLKLATTKVEAKKINKDYDSIEVPTDKPGLMEILQDLLDRAQPATSIELQHSLQEKPRPQPAPTTSPPLTPSVDTFVDFVLDTASVSQVGRIFEALGSRFKEIVQELTAINSVQPDEEPPS